jgi:hypothetical protein
MNAEIRIASLEDSQMWQAIQSRSGIASHSWSFNLALSFSGIDPKLALVQTDESALIFPFYERRWRDEVDICTTLSVSGAVIQPARQECLSAWAEFGVAKGWVAGYLQFEPETDLRGIEDATAGNQVFLLDLSRWDLFADTAAIIRRKIRRADKLGVALVEDRQALADALRRLYPETMARSGALAHYHFSDRTLESWICDPGSLAIGAAAGSSVEAVAVFPFFGERAEYHIGATSAEGRHLTAWLLWRGIQKLRELGIRILNLGGGVRPQDGLYQFKEKFGGQSLALHSVNQIYHPNTYRRLCLEAEIPTDTTWFPGYRAKALV